MHLPTRYFFLLAISSLPFILMAQPKSKSLALPAASTGNSPQLLSSSKADTWVATDAEGRNLRLAPSGGKIRPDRYVGIFYFIWHGAHGYDSQDHPREDEGVMDKKPGDTLSPFDITQMLAVDPVHPKYGPRSSSHYWSEPAFGYYLSDDEWVIRKHAQMLSDAGVDLIILDITNTFLYLPQLKKLMSTWETLRKEGRSTPAFACIVNSEPKATVNRLYAEIYAKGLFSDLWFRWKGKPLLLCPPEALSDTTKKFFNTRHSWAWSSGQEWFADGKDKWPWLDHTPQNYGWHESKDRPEELSVAVAEHPISGIGRSFHDGKEPLILQSGTGLYFAEQWDRAMEVDPELVFVTGWNEWVAMRFVARSKNTMVGKKIGPGDTYFVDEYSEEYSRDAEPENGQLQDNYYYQLVDGIRRYKGSRPLPLATGNFPIRIDGIFADWTPVSPEFSDDAGDTFHRSNKGYGRIKEYVNTTGRNDITLAKVAASPDHLSFYVRTAGQLTVPDNAIDSNWMVLYLRIPERVGPAWQGFQFRVNRLRTSDGKPLIERYAGGGIWRPAGAAAMALKGKEMELSIPKSGLGITGPHFSIDLKWTDNIPCDSDPMRWLDTGDTAPDGRFRYRYIR